MDKLWEFGRKAIFYVRVLSGYEERRIRYCRLQLEKRLKQAEERKAAVRKIPEQIILPEVRRMVEQMQAMNKKLQETEKAIEEYFKPLDKSAEMIIKMQLEGEEKKMNQMLDVIIEKAEKREFLLKKEEARVENVALDHRTELNNDIEEAEIIPEKPCSKMMR